MEKKRPLVKAKYTENGAFMGAYPSEVDPYELPGKKFPIEDVFLHGSVASANDCTGVAVVMPETEEEGESIAQIRKGIPVTYTDDPYEPTSRPAPQRHQ